jgi:hypothetical protein
VRIRIVGTMAALLTPFPGLAEPRGGDLFREYTYGNRFSEVDPATKRDNLKERVKVARSERFLDIPEAAAAERAEVVVAYWGGHTGTGSQSFQINGGPWIDLPQPQGTPTPPQCYYRTLLRATVEIPATQLKAGLNSFRFRAGPQVCHNFDWGFYWVYSFTVRLYFKPPAHHPAGEIVSHTDGGRISDFPEFTVAARSPESPIQRVDVIANYQDYNWEGDGVFRQWHYILQRGQMAKHVGSASSPPYLVRWDTRWTPDQSEPVEVAARITDIHGLIYQTPSVRLKLVRQGRSVRLYRASEVPEIFGVRIGRRMSCKIPVGDDLSTMRSARLVLFTWSAAHAEEIGLNDRKLVDRIGVVHNYSFDSLPVPNSLIKRGDNSFYLTSTTKEHAAEINWPGPALLIEFGDPATAAAAPSPWPDARATHRVRIEVDAGGWDRTGRVVEAALNNLPLGTAPIRLLESGRETPFQFDRDGDRSGTIVFVAEGETARHKVRAFDVYLGSAPSARPGGAGIEVRDDVEWQGQKSFRIETPAATYLYHKEGAGFASILDRNGADWLSYRPQGGSAGNYRGLPNLGNDFGHAGHSGQAGSVSRLVSRGPLRVRILSEGVTGRWAAMWDIFPASARMTMLKAGEPYWFLYEGTPGGRLDAGRGTMILSNGEVRSLAEPWSGNLERPKWAAFSSATSPWMLSLASHDEDANTPDQYWPMEDNMTVFGFGRRYTGKGWYLTRTPARFSIALIPRSDPATASRTIASIVQDVGVSVGAAEAR